MSVPNRIRHPASPWFVLQSLWRHRELVWEMTKRDVIGRYRGSVMGILWSFLNPLLMLTIYTFVFRVIFRARWGGEDISRSEFALVLFAGLIVHALFAECVNRAPTLVVGNVNFVKKVVFPLEILPWVVMGSAMFHTLISVFVLVIALAVVQAEFHWSVLLLPVVLLPLVLLTMGVSWFVASLGVFLRDVSHTTGLLTTMLLFLSPVFFPVAALPAEYRWMLQVNPLTYIIEQSRDVVFWGKAMDWGAWGIHVSLGMLVAWLGLIWFQRTRQGFADVL